jgi:hypothetical protein
LWAHRKDQIGPVHLSFLWKETVMAFALRCSACRKTFRWDPAKPVPEACLLCNTLMASDKSDDDSVIVMPNFLSTRTKQNDQLQRQTVDASEVRMHKAAEMAGCDAADMSNLKITDLKSTKHEGDVAIAPVNNVVSQHMDAMAARGMPVGFGNQEAMNYAAQAHTGPDARAGARAAEKTQRILHGMR